MTFQKLRVLERIEEIEGVCSLVLENPAGYTYHAGQHLPLRFHINGQEARRTYTLSSSPTDPHLKITVKRVKGGLVSNYINDHVKVGNFIEARPPIGYIFVECLPHTYRTFYLFAAGSGITPMMSIARTVLAQSPHSYIRLFYGNQSEDTIIFRQQLEVLQSKFGNRLAVVHTLTKPTRESWSALWRTDLIKEARKGYIDDESVRWFLDTHRPVAQDCAYFVCGPGTMNETVRQTLLSLAVPEEDIHIEYFKAPEKKVGVPAGLVNAQATIKLQGQTSAIPVSKGQTVLQAALEANLDAPYSCEAGICATCRARLISGQVHMPSAPALEKKEIQQGYILTCQAHPKTPQLTVEY